MSEGSGTKRKGDDAPATPAKTRSRYTSQPFKSPLITRNISAATSASISTPKRDGAIEPRTPNSQTIEKKARTPRMGLRPRTPFSVNSLNDQAENDAVSIEKHEKDCEELRETESKLRLELSALICSSEGEVPVIGDDEVERMMSEYIELLHEYNEVKDCAQLVLGKIAEKKGVTIKALYSDYGIEFDD
ncbi:Swi5-domain-containing protein [Chytridium lagenaria]|nr:Swi5-domain-containing protein [Chytridium lagenaria]